ncbi:transposable element Tcb1 transposase [Trichonephila clavipes]|nr:transposable element Tcb1 transposase [Trichonephila clavipes]
MSLMDRTATSLALNQELRSFARQVSGRTVRRRLQQRGLSAWRPWLRLPLTLHHRQKCLQWCDQRRTRAHEWRYVVLSDESTFCLRPQDGRICVWRHRVERTLAACICHRQTSPSPIVKVCCAIGYTSRH